MPKQSKAKIPTSLSPFQESRIRAQGWNAARDSSEPSRNPYADEPERSLWLEGYTKGHA